MVKNAHAGSGHRDEYWETTREQLKSAQNRADLLSVLGVAAIGGLLWYYHEPGDGFGRFSLSFIGLALVVICVPAWVAARRRRRISAARGLTCPSCGYVPHDTEISEVVSTRHCQRCDHSLD
jgi:hypothetical protein